MTTTANGGGRWSFWVDRGGTFTDCLGRDPATGAIHVVKVPSSPGSPLVAMRRLLGLTAEAPIPACDLRLGTTVATNALLERRGARTLLVVTRGFRDLCRLGTQARPDLFAVDIASPVLLYEAVVETSARGAPDGSTVALVDRDALQQALGDPALAGIESVAVAVLHGHRAPDLERQVAAVVREAGFEDVVCSHEASAEIGYLARSETGLVDAYLTPLLRRYLDELRGALPGSRVLLMQSSGGLAEPARFRGPAAILSGPAGGLVACREVARRHGAPQAIGFDMGGTSTDVSRVVDGPFEHRFEQEVAGLRLRSPMLPIHTVAAGGGSICRLVDGRFVVGPESAGADPGPLAYGRAEAIELTVTDCNLVAGRLVSDRFPMPLNVTRARAALADVAARLPGTVAGGVLASAESVAEGFLEVADAHMADAIRRVSVARGYDVRDHALVVFGGAGGQHACSVARRLGIRRILIHPWAGVLSAWGIGLASIVEHATVELLRVALDDEGVAAAASAAADPERRVKATLVAGGHAEAAISTTAQVDARYRGSDAAISVELPADTTTAQLREAFEAAHQRRFGYRRPGHPVELVVVRVAGEVATEAPETSAEAERGTSTVSAATEVFWGGRLLSDVPVIDRAALSPSETVAGPAVVLDDTGTTWLEPGFELTRMADGTLQMELGEAVRGRVASTDRDPVTLELFASSFMSIAEQMGEALRRTSISVNIRERLDFSCAVFSPDADLVANAPHIPVHLGAMSETVRAVSGAFPDPKPGDAFVSNDPAAGGSHLPDVTVVTPVFDRSGCLRAYVASRGHHADIGGVTPGSMPPFSTTLDEEGVVIRPQRLIEGDRFLGDELLRLLQSGSYPAREPQQNLADLQAQAASNRTGATLLDGLADDWGNDVVAAYMQHIQDQAAEAVSAALTTLPEGPRRFEDALDDGTPIIVEIERRGDRLRVDFAGTGEAVRGNLNAPRSVTVAAVLYAVRVLVGRPIPLSSGCLRMIDLTIPPGSILDPPIGSAVAGGNVETSQRVVDVLLGAMGLAAASQGTMNNLTFGNDRFGYYETIAGGAGATATAAGASAVHTHMTNTRITDAEVLEDRFPVRLVEHAVRAGSGGAGRHRGGDGVVRRLQALSDLTGSLLSERRTRAPFGLAGGEPAMAGLADIDGLPIAAKATFELRAGQTLSVETPGGGGYGQPAAESSAVDRGPRLDAANPEVRTRRR